MIFISAPIETGVHKYSSVTNYVVYKLGRSGADLGGFNGKPDGGNNVELEKNNVLLMGPIFSALVRHL